MFSPISSILLLPDHYYDIVPTHQHCPQSPGTQCSAQTCSAFGVVHFSQNKYHIHLENIWWQRCASCPVSFRSFILWQSLLPCWLLSWSSWYRGQSGRWTMPWWQRGPPGVSRFLFCLRFNWAETSLIRVSCCSVQTISPPGPVGIVCGGYTIYTPPPIWLSCIHCILTFEHWAFPLWALMELIKLPLLINWC